MKNWRIWLGIAVSGLLLYLALRGLQLEQVYQAMLRARYGWLIPGVLVYFIGLGVRSWRWHYLLRPVKSVPTVRLFPITTIGYMGNNIYPARICVGRPPGCLLRASLGGHAGPAQDRDVLHRGLSQTGTCLA